MEAIRRKRISAVDLRARFPVITRVLALFILVVGLVFVAISIYRLRNNQPFRLRSGSPELSKEIIGRIEGFDQRITKGDRLFLWLRAASDITYSDGHHELEKVQLEVYPATGDKPDRITADRSIYDQQHGMITFNGNVNIETRDALKVKTETMAYNQNSEIGETAAPLSFERENVSGQATGAIVDAKNKRLELRSDVQVSIAPEALKEPQAKPNNRSQPVNIRAARAVFEQSSMRLTFSGGATAEQDRDLMSGDNLTGVLNQKKRLQKIELRGNSYLRTMNEGRAAEVHAADMDFFLDDDQRLKQATGSRDVRAQSLDSDSEMQLSGANTVDVTFQPQADRSLLKELHTGGRSVVTLSAPKSRAGDARAANKRLSADAVKLVWRTMGRDLERAEAVGNAELFVDPIQKDAKADRQTLTAPRFDGDFYETGNLARNFTATGGAKAVIDPVIPSQERSTRTITSQKMVAVFARETQKVDRLDAQGDARFNEQDRNGIAGNMVFTAMDQTVRLRGGEPTVWDSHARTTATELDSDTANHISYGRGKTQTAYYSQEQTNGATPFSKVKSPVYIVAERAEFHHESGVANYAGNARAWQDDNFVRGDTIALYREQKRMESRGRVQSGLYQAKRRTPGGATVIPVFASSDFMWYSDPDRVLHYEGNVDIKQGTDRVTSGVADVYLSKESNEVDKTIAQRNVVLTQPGKRGTGDWLQYTAADEVAVLKGNPARVEDVEQGSTEGARLTVYMRENRVVADDSRGSQSTGRVRSVHRIKKP
ncbi:MAG TPA: LPS export ABC transporter periplasmic protein LptC [Pyrinomonadaceae bacterium]